MQLNEIPHALVVRLGDEATVALLEVLDRSHREARDELILACTERFERRLVEQVSGLRVEIAESRAELRTEMSALRADLRQEMSSLRADLRQEISALGGDLRQEMSALGGDLRQEMSALGGDLRQEIAAGRVDLFKWCFLFWVGQVLAMSGIMGVMLRLMR
jgi:hypothetical protein